MGSLSYEFELSQDQGMLNNAQMTKPSFTAANYETLSENELIHFSQQGNKDAYGTLVKRHMKRAYHTALAMVGSHDGALDLSQDAFVRAYHAIKKLNTESKFFTWYYRILKNLCLNFLRDKSRHSRPFSEMDEHLLERIKDDAEDASVALEKKQMQVQVWKAIHSLKPHEKEIIVLKDFEDLSYKEISELLDCPVGTVMSRLYNARQALKEKLKGYIL